MKAASMISPTFLIIFDVWKCEGMKNVLARLKNERINAHIH